MTRDRSELRVVVIDRGAERRALVRARLGRIGCFHVSEARTDREATRALTDRSWPASTPGLVLIETAACTAQTVRLVTHATALRPLSLFVGVGDPPNARGAFELARAGVEDLLSGPPTVDELAVLSAAAVAYDRALRSALGPLVGNVPWRDIQARVRVAVLEEALERSNGSRRAAARLLGVSRTAVQHMLRSTAAK